MNYSQYSRTIAQSKHDKSIFLRGTVFIEELNRVVIVEHRLGFGKRNAMTLEVGLGFRRIPPKLNHTYIVCIDVGWSNGERGARNTLIDPNDHPWYGIPYPGTYVIGADGTINHKFFDNNLAVRAGPEQLLRAATGETLAGQDEGSIPADSVQVSVALDGDAFAPTVQNDLVARFRIPAGRHVYADPAPAGSRWLRAATAAHRKQRGRRGRVGDHGLRRDPLANLRRGGVRHSGETSPRAGRTCGRFSAGGTPQQKGRSARAQRHGPLPPDVGTKKDRGQTKSTFHDQVFREIPLHRRTPGERFPPSFKTLQFRYTDAISNSTLITTILSCSFCYELPPRSDSV